MENMLNCTALVVGSAMLTDVLDAPVAELAMGKQIDLRQDLFDSRSLLQTLATFSGMTPSLYDMIDCEAGRTELLGRDDLRHMGYLRMRRDAKEAGLLTFSSSTQFSKMFCTTRLPVSPKATSCHIPASASFTLAMTWGGLPVHRSSNSFCQT